MGALDVAKGASTDKVDGRVANWWRPSEPCTCRCFAAAWSAGGSSGTARLEAACGTLELRDQRRSNIAIGPSPSTGAYAWWLSSCSAIRLPACASGPAPAVGLGYSGGLCSPPWVPNGGHLGV